MNMKKYKILKNKQTKENKNKNKNTNECIHKMQH